MTSFVVSSSDYAQANDDVNYHSRENVESVKPSYKEKELGVLLWAILVLFQVRAINHTVCFARIQCFVVLFGSARTADHTFVF